MPKSKSKSSSETTTPQDATAPRDAEKEPPVIACSWEEVEQHLRAFIDVFVEPQARGRWIEFLIEKRPEWDDSANPRRLNPRWARIGRSIHHLFTLSHVDPQYRYEIPSAQRFNSFEEAVGEPFKGYGVYFSLRTPPCKMTAAEANQLLYKRDDTALLSFRAGKRVLFFAHSEGVWVCQQH